MALYEPVWTGLKKIRGTDHADTLLCGVNLADIYWREDVYMGLSAVEVTVNIRAQTALPAGSRPLNAAFVNLGFGDKETTLDTPGATVECGVWSGS